MVQQYNLEERENMRSLAAQMREAARVAQREGLLTKATDLMVAAIDLEDGADQQTVYPVTCDCNSGHLGAIHIQGSVLCAYYVPVDPADETICEACS